jgi:WD40 repeat protein
VPSVTIGGRAAVKVQSLGDLGLGSFQGVSALLPQGTPGQSPDITISSADGSATLTQQVTYIPSASIVPASGLLQILYDGHRNMLYALKATEVDVLNPVTLQWQTPFPLPGPGGSTGNYNTIALSPDGSRLVAVSPNGYVGVLNPDSPSGVSVVTGTNPGTQTGSVAITKFNKALIAGSPNVEVDLATLGVRTMFAQFGDVQRTSADGGLLYGVALNISSGEVFAIDPATYSVETSVYGFLFWTDLAVSADGSQFATIDGSPGAAGDIIGFFDPNLHFLNTNEYPLVSPPDDVEVIGANFSPQGKVLVVALGDSIEFWDAAKGTLRARLMTPEQLHSLAFPGGRVAPQVALDATGQTIFAISQTGLTAMKLSQPVDNLASQAWALGVHPATQQGALSGGLKARAAAMQKSRSK